MPSIAHLSLPVLPPVEAGDVSVTTVTNPATEQPLQELVLAPGMVNAGNSVSQRLASLER